MSDPDEELHLRERLAREEHVRASSNPTRIEAVPAHRHGLCSRTPIPAERAEGTHHRSERQTLRYANTLFDSSSSHGMALLAHTLDG